MTDGPLAKAQNLAFPQIASSQFRLRALFSMKSHWALGCMTPDRYPDGRIRCSTPATAMSRSNGLTDDIWVETVARGASSRKCMSMSSKSKREGITEIQATAIQAETGDVSVGNSSRDEEIGRRAYEIYLERGEQPGCELDDWLQAERQLDRGMLPNSERRSATADMDLRPLLNCHDLGDC
jgi:hypothetical protein